MDFDKHVGSGVLINGLRELLDPTRLIRYKRIASFLFSDRRLRSMPGKQSSLVGQGKDLGFDAVLQLLPARARQVRAANRAREDNITAEAHASTTFPFDRLRVTPLTTVPVLFGSAEIGDIQNTMTGCMPWREADLKFDASQTQNLSRIKIDRRFGARINVEAEKLAASDRKSTRLNSSHSQISYAVFCL